MKPLTVARLVHAAIGAAVVTGALVAVLVVAIAWLFVWPFHLVGALARWVDASYAPTSPTAEWRRDR